MSKTYCIVYPDGDSQEIDQELRINQIVDLNGNVLPLPLKTPKMIAYRVYKITKDIQKGSETIYFYLELLNVFELTEHLAH